MALNPYIEKARIEDLDRATRRLEAVRHDYVAAAEKSLLAGYRRAPLWARTLLKNAEIDAGLAIGRLAGVRADAA